MYELLAPEIQGVGKQILKSGDSYDIDTLGNRPKLLGNQAKFNSVSFVQKGSAKEGESIARRWII